MEIDFIERNVDTNQLLPLIHSTGNIETQKLANKYNNLGRNLVIGSITLIGALAYEGQINSQVIDNFINKNISPKTISGFYHKSNLIDFFEINKKKEEALIYSKDTLIEEILSFKSLSNNWDGYGALPLEIKAAANAIKFVGKLNIDEMIFLKDFFPNPHGTISFLFENKTDEIVSLEIGNSKMSYYVKLNSGNISFNDDKQVNETEINKLIKKISVL